MAGPAGFEPAAFGFVVRFGVLCRRTLQREACSAERVLEPAKPVREAQPEAQWPVLQSSTLPDGRIMIPRKRAARAGDIGASQVQIGGSRHESEPRKDAWYAGPLRLPIREADARRAADLDPRELRRRTSLFYRRLT